MGGAFTTAGGMSANHIAEWDGLNWQPLGSGLAPSSSSVSPSALIDFQNNLVIGGNFTIANNQVSAYLARWRECPCASDVVPPGGDGLVGIDELLAVIGAWGPCPVLPPDCAADITHDGFVEISDLLAVINSWGPCP